MDKWYVAQIDGISKETKHLRTVMCQRIKADNIYEAVDMFRSLYNRDFIRITGIRVSECVI